jgi:hypothetical protein
MQMHETPLVECEGSRRSRIVLSTCEYIDCCEMRSQDAKLNSQKRCFPHDKETEELRNEKSES